MKPLDKKQIPQVVVMAVLAVGVFGYFISKMIVPSPVSASTQPAKASAAVTNTSAVAALPPAVIPAPGPDMRDPFVQTVSGDATPAAPPVAAPAPASVPVPKPVSLERVSAGHVSVPTVPVLPSEFAPGQPTASPIGMPEAASPRAAAPVLPLPVPPPTPAWIVTGVLQSGSQHIAVLRNGEDRRFVTQGEDLDGEFKIVSVTRDAVVLRHGSARFVLPLGGAKSGHHASVSEMPTLAVPHAVTVPARVIPSRIAMLTAPSAPLTLNISRSLPTSFPALPKVVHVAQTVVKASPRRPVVRVADYLNDEVPGILSATERSTPSGMLRMGSIAPEFSLNSGHGSQLSLSQFRGQVVVLTFWASWDAASMKALTALRQLSRLHSGQGLTVLAVNSWDSGGAAACQSGDGIVTLFDPSVSNESIAVGLYNVPDVPAMYIIDRSGRIAGAYVGFDAKAAEGVRATLAKLNIP